MIICPLSALHRMVFLLHFQGHVLIAVIRGHARPQAEANICVVSLCECLYVLKMCLILSVYLHQNNLNSSALQCKQVQAFDGYTLEISLEVLRRGAFYFSYIIPIHPSIQINCFLYVCLYMFPIREL